MSEKPISCSWCRASHRADAKTCASCGAPLSQKPREEQVAFARALPRGTRLRGGDYELQDVIGQGRFGITYRALNHRLNRVVAIKEWFPSACERDGLQVLAGHNLSAEEFAQGKATFLEEARGLARFEHPAIVSLFAVWEENRSAYMEMELLHGPTLSQVLARFHHLKADDALRLFAPILDALQQLHAENWLHRDLNPHNIVLRGAAFEARDAATCVQNSRAVLIDFGAACQIAPGISQEFSVLVTPGYAPLEQYAVRARRGVYSDIYALCATLYHALSGQIPPPAPDRATGTVLVPLRDLAPAVPQQFCRAIESGLEIEIARRPQTVGDLQKLLPPLPVQNAPQLPLQVLAAPVARVAPVEKAPQVLAPPLAWPKSADDARATVDSSTDKRARGMLWAMGLGPFAFALLMGVLFLRPQVEMNWGAPASRLIDEPPIGMGQNSPIDLSGGRWQIRQSERIISATDSITGKSWYWNVADSTTSMGISLAPNDSWLMAVGTYSDAVSSGGRVWFFDLETGATINVWSGKSQDDNGASFATFFSPQGRYVGIKRFDNVLRIWEVRTHRDFAFRWPESDGLENLSLFTSDTTEFSPDENYILLGNGSQNLWLVDLGARTIRQTQVPIAGLTEPSPSHPISIDAHFTDDSQHIDWFDNITKKTGRLSVDDFTQKADVEIIDGATSRPS